VVIELTFVFEISNDERWSVNYNVRWTFQDDLGRVHMTWNEAEIMASDRSCWRQAAAQCAMSHGRN